MDCPCCRNTEFPLFSSFPPGYGERETLLVRPYYPANPVSMSLTSGFVEELILRLERASGLSTGVSVLNHPRLFSCDRIEDIYKSRLFRFGSHFHSHE